MLSREEVIEKIEANSFNTDDGDNCISVDDMIEILNDLYISLENLKPNPKEDSKSNNNYTQ